MTQGVEMWTTIKGPHEVKLFLESSRKSRVQVYVSNRRRKIKMYVNHNGTSVKTQKSVSWATQREMLYIILSTWLSL